MFLIGCDFAWYVTKGIGTDLYKSAIPESTTTIEKIETLDGKSIVVRITSKYYLNRYVYSLESDGYPDWKYEGEFRVSSDGRELPVSFDVVNKTPWIVLPVKSNQCSGFGFPREGLVFLKLDGKSWKKVPYDEAPKNLRVNLLQNRDAYKNGAGMDKASCVFGIYDQFGGFVCKPDPKLSGEVTSYYVGDEGVFYSPKESTKPILKNNGRTLTPEFRQYLDAQIEERYTDYRYTNKSGVGKTINEIVEANLTFPNIANTESCYYLNPPVDPDERKSLKEFVEKSPISIQTDLIRSVDEEFEISDAQQQQLYLPMKVFGNCSQVVSRNFNVLIAGENQEEFAGVAGVPSGTFKSPGTAARVELNSIDGIHSIYLPIRGFSAADRVSAMLCQANRIFINFGGALNEWQIMEYDLNARLLNKWQIKLPTGFKGVGSLSELAIGIDRIRFKLVDFERSGNNNGKIVPTKIKHQYYLEAKLPK